MGRSYVILAAALAVAIPANPRADGIGVSLQGQIGAGNVVRDVKTDTNLVYGAILGLHFGLLGLEVDYQHAENDLQGSSAVFKQDGLLGHLRLDFTKGPLVPFVYSGVGWLRATSSQLSGSNDRAVIPAGAGIEFHALPLVLGIRGEYQWATSEIAGQHADFWKAVATVGVRFQ
jgi:hypothetical protein